MNVTDGIHHIRCPFRISGYFTGVTAILGDTITLIDTGLSTSPKDTIFPYLKDVDREADEISHIILTHTHGDHFEGVPSILEVSDAHVYVHAQGESKVLDLASRTSFDPSRVEVVNHGDVLKLSNHEVEVFHTPGHSADSICLLDRKLGVCVSGDSIQGLGEERPLLFYSSIAYINSMERLFLEPVNILAMGHPFPLSEQGIVRGGNVKVILQESIRAVENLKEKVVNVLKACGRPLSTKEISKRLPEVREPSIEPVLSELSGDGRLRRLGKGNYVLWLSR
jgi:glyoxylase-like metal-dependent hydrolase (beta-lactamase superfamily II)